MSDFVPTTDQVRRGWLELAVWKESSKYPEDVLAEFDRWLSAHDEQVQSEYDGFMKFDKEKLEVENQLLEDEVTTLKAEVQSIRVAFSMLRYDQKEARDV